MQKLVKEKKDPDLDLRVYNEEGFERIIPFTKKASSEVPTVKYIFYNTTTKKEEEVEFYNYFLHPEKFGFEWIDNQIEFRYSIELSTDEKKLIKKK